MPDIGFAPDADFPIINAEKGIIDVSLRIVKNASDKDAKTCFCHSVQDCA